MKSRTCRFIFSRLVLNYLQGDILGIYPGVTKVSIYEIHLGTYLKKSLLFPFKAL